jgi:hypothetical protein
VSSNPSVNKNKTTTKPKIKQNKKPGYRSLSEREGEIEA